MRLEFIGNIITFFAALFAVLSRETIDGGKVGLSVTYALSVSSLILAGILLKICIEKIIQC